MAEQLLTCLVTTGSEASEAVVEQLVEWAEAGFIGRGTVVRLPTIRGLPGPAPRIPVSKIAETIPASADLLRMVASGRWSQLLLLILFDIESSIEQRPGSGDLGEQSLHLIGEVKDAMPTAFDASKRGSLGLTTVRLVAPSSDGSPFPFELGRFHRYWDHSLVLAPEDRRAPDAAADHVRWPGNYASHVAGAIAGLGGLWSGLDREALPLSPPDSDGSGPDTAAFRVVRTQCRIAGAPAPVDVVQQQVLRIAQGEQEYPGGSEAKLRTAGNFASRKLVMEAQQELQEHPTHTLTYTAVPDAEELRDALVKRADLLDSIWRFTFGDGRTKGERKFRFAGAMAEPLRALQAWFRGTVDEVVEEVAAGKGAGVRVATSLVDEMGREWDSEWQALREAEAHRPMKEPSPDDAAEYWSTMRSWVLGLVDGSRPGIKEELVDAIDVVSDRALIAPEPVRADYSDASAMCIGEDEAISPYNYWASAASVIQLNRVAAELSPQVAVREGAPSLHEAAPEEVVSAHDALVAGDKELAELDRERVADDSASQRETRRRRRKPRKQRGGGWLLGILLALAGLIGAGFLYYFDERFPAIVLAVLCAPLLAWSISARRRNRRFKSRSRPPLKDPDISTALGGTHPMLAKPIDTMAKSFVETDAAALADDARRISSWLEQYRPTLLGQLSLGLAQGTDHATDDYQRTLSKYRSLEHFETSDLRKRQWSWFFWFWFGPLLLLSGLLLIGWWYTQKAGPTVNLLVGEVDTETFTGVVVVLWTVLCVFYYVRALLRYHKAYLQARHQMTLWARTAAALSRQLTHSRHEAYRLRATNRRLARWAEVFSWVVRHPYGRPEPAESLADVHSEVADIGRSETPALSEPEAPPPGPDEVMATAESPPDSQPRADEASRLEAMEGAQGSSGSARTTPGDSEVERALSTQIVDVTLSHAFTEGELRRAVAMSSGYGWLNSLFYRLVRHSFLNLGLNAHEAVRRMDREGSEPQSYLDMFANELWRGDCQREVASELSERLAEHRAEIEETSGSGFVKLAVDALVGNQTVEAFLTEIAAQGTTMRRDLFRPSALVDKAHVLEQGLLWTHSYAESQAGRAPSNVTVFTEEVEPHTERIQLVAVRLDVTGVVDPAGLACFSEKRSEAPRRGDSAGGVDLV